MEQQTAQGPAGYSFSDIFGAMASASRLEEVLNQILVVSLRELSADNGSILLLQGNENPQLKMLAAIGLPEEVIQRGYVARKGSISEYVLHELRPIIVNDEPPPQSTFSRMPSDTATRRRIVSALCVPLIARGRVLGTMNLNRTRGEARFTERDTEACSVIAGQAALVIEHHRLQEELQQQERLAAVGQTVAGISHCVKNILSGVRGGLGLTEMGMEQKNDTLMTEGFQLLKRSVGTLSTLVLDLLDYSKEREPFRELFRVSPLLEQVVETTAYKAATLGVEVVREAAPELSCYADRDQIFRALLNLTTNAVEAAGEGYRADHPPRVDLRVRTASASEGQKEGKELVVFEIEDNGPGIPDEARERIWDIFFSTKGSRGTGLGLATSRKVVEEHGGTITLETSPERGTLFRMTLPAPGAVVDPRHPGSAAGGDWAVAD